MGMGGSWLGLFLAGSLSVLAASTAADERCDVKKTRTDMVCAECEEIVKAKEHCGAAPVKVEHCVKEVYVCEECDESASKPGKCPGCEGKMTKSEDLARTYWECPECGDESQTKGKCGECDVAYVKTCEKSGSEPHVAPAKKEKGAKKAKKEKSPPAGDDDDEDEEDDE